jgi:hypothetical protein
LNKIIYHKYIDNNSIIIFEYLWKITRPNQGNIIYSAKLLSYFHKIGNRSNKNVSNNNFFDFSDENILYISWKLKKYINDFNKNKFILKVTEIKNMYLNDKNNWKIIHNDLYIDQFYFSDSWCILMDLNFLTVWNPIVDLCSLLRNDYENRNNFNKQLFFRSYKYFSWKNFSVSDFKYWFNLNSFRDIIWFIKRLEEWKDKNWEVINWLNDAYTEIIKDNFDSFYSDLIL